MRNATDAMRESRVHEIVNLVWFFSPATSLHARYATNYFSLVDK